MVGIYSAPVEANNRLAAMGLDALPSNTADVLWATAEESWIRNPLPSMGRLLDRSAEQALAFGYAGRNLVIPPDPAQQLHPEVANSKYAIPGHLEFDSYVPEATARDLYALKRAELRRQAVFARAEGGFGQGAAQLAVGFLVSAMDPLNIASAFIPSVGPARVAIWSARLGRPAARGFAGAIEGAVGAALLEPLVLGAARGEQADYDEFDSFLNLVFGAGLGSGLHVGAGALGDLFARRAAQAAAAGSQPLAAADRGLTPGAIQQPVQSAQARLTQAWQSAPAHRRAEALSAAVASLVEGRVIDDRIGRLLEQHLLGRAYDDTLASPQGHFDDNLVTLSPKIIEDVVLSRGGWDGTGDVTIKGQGWGTAKIIWKHGEKSTEPPAQRVSREDVLALPDVLRDYEPTVTRDANGVIVNRTWRVRRPFEGGERTIVYGVAPFTDPKSPGHAAPDGGVAPHRVVTIFVDQGASRPLSVRSAGGSGSPARLLRPGGDTAPGRFDPSTGRRNLPAPENIGALAAARNAGAPEDAAVSAAVERQVQEPDALDPASDNPVAALDEQTALLLAEVKAAEAGGETVDRTALEAAETLAGEADETAKALDAAASCLARRGA